MASDHHHHHHAQHPGQHHAHHRAQHWGRHQGGQQPDSLATKVLAAGAGQRMLMVLPAIIALWAAVAWALLGDA